MVIFFGVMLTFLLGDKNSFFCFKKLEASTNVKDKKNLAKSQSRNFFLRLGVSARPK